MKYFFIDDCYKNNSKYISNYILQNSTNVNLWQANLNKNFLLRLNYFDDYEDNPYYFKICHWMYNHYLNPDERLAKKVNFEKIIKSPYFPVMCGVYFDVSKNVITDFEMLQNNTLYYIKDNYVYDILNDTAIKIENDMVISYHFLVHKLENIPVYFMYINNLLCNNNIEIKDNYNDRTDFKIKDCIFSQVDDVSDIYSKLIYPQALNDTCELFYSSDHNYKFKAISNKISVDLRYEDNMPDDTCSPKGLKERVTLDLEIVSTNAKNAVINNWNLMFESECNYTYVLLRNNNDSFFEDDPNKNTVLLEFIK